MRYLIVLVLMLSLQGCGIAMLVGALSYADTNTKKMKFDLARLNMEREEKGMEPLTLKQFNRGEYPDSPGSGGRQRALSMPPQ